jgi:hypothetical protein
MANMHNITEIFCEIDDFVKEFDKFQKGRSLESGKVKTRNKHSKLSISEVMTIMVLFHLYGFRNLKTFYINYVQNHLRSEFPETVSYNRFVELQQKSILPMLFFLLKARLGKCTGISFIDSTPLRVCHNRRIHCNKVFSGLAERGHSSIGYFYGFKLHIVINDKGELLNFMFTQANVDDREPLKNKGFIKRVFGKLFGDKGYLSKELTELLFVDGINLITKLRKNMVGRTLSAIDSVLLRKRALIESVNDELKNICQIEHSRHRSFSNFFSNLLSALTSYTFFAKKPSLDLSELNEKSFQPVLF